MTTSGTYVTEIPLKGSAEKHHKRWKSENDHLFAETIGHHIKDITVHEGEHDSHGSIRSWNYIIDGKPEVFKEKREIDDVNKTLTLRGVEGHVMELYKVYDLIFQFIPKSEDSCVCKLTLIWEKRNDDFPEPSGFNTKHKANINIYTNNQSGYSLSLAIQQ